MPILFNKTEKSPEESRLVEKPAKVTPFERVFGKLPKEEDICRPKINSGCVVQWIE